MAPDISQCKGRRFTLYIRAKTVWVELMNFVVRVTDLKSGAPHFQRKCVLIQVNFPDCAVHGTPLKRPPPRY